MVSTTVHLKLHLLIKKESSCGVVSFLVAFLALVLLLLVVQTESVLLCYLCGFFLCGVLHLYIIHVRVLLKGDSGILNLHTDEQV
jgi:hypothetical protein